jgi:short-subunit dehydrogenase
MQKTVVITGATSGIGFSLAEIYLKYGDKIIITGRSKEKLDLAQSKFASYENFLGGYLLDVKDEEKMKEFLLKMDDKYKVDIVIANAGISAGVSDITNMDALGKEIFDINVYGLFNTVHPLITRMKERKSGQIVLISSMSAFFGLASAVFYASSKAAVKSYGEGLRLLLKPYNINVTTVFPGFVESNITRANHFSMPFFMTTEKAVKIIKRGLDVKKGYILFPLRMRLLVYFTSILPFFIREKILQRLPNKN